VSASTVILQQRVPAQEAAHTGPPPPRRHQPWPVNGGSRPACLLARELQAHLIVIGVPWDLTRAPAGSPGEAQATVLCLPRMRSRMRPVVVGGEVRVVMAGSRGGSWGCETVIPFRQPWPPRLAWIPAAVSVPERRVGSTSPADCWGSRHC